MRTNPVRRPAAIALAVLVATLGVASVAHAQAGSGSNGLLGRLVGQPAQQAGGDVTLVKVRGTGSVPVTPDRVSMTITIARQAPTAAEALASHGDAVAKVVAALGEAGVPAEAITSGAATLAPIAGAVAAAESADTTRGVRVANTLTLGTDQISDLTRLVQVALDSGADEVADIEWQVAEPERQRAMALRAAVAAAAADGRALAEALGGRVTRVVEATTVDSGTVRPVSPASPAPRAAGNGAPTSAPQASLDAAVELTLAVTGAELPTAPTRTPRRSAPASRPGATAGIGASAGVTGTITAQPTVAATATAGRTAGTPTTAATTAPDSAATAAPASAPAGAPAAARSARGIPFVSVAQADTGRYRGTRARAIVATSAADWARMVAPLLPRTVRLEPDYEQEVAVVVFLGERPSTGFGVKVREVTTEDGQLTLHVDTVEPAGALDRATGPTSPFHVITLRRTDLPAGVTEPLQAEVMP